MLTGVFTKLADKAKSYGHVSEIILIFSMNSTLPPILINDQSNLPM